MENACMDWRIRDWVKMLLLPDCSLKSSRAQVMVIIKARTPRYLAVADCFAPSFILLGRFSWDASMRWAWPGDSRDSQAWSG
jgi:hypothetical protein